jgi:hypothetical protein
VSLLSRKQHVDEVSGFRGHAMSAARQAMPAAMNVTSAAAQQAVPLAMQAVPLARQTVPLAWSAGTSVKHGADGAVAWAAPIANAARSWAAPRLEHSAVVISDNIAPMISDALIAAAHKIDTSKPKQSRISKSSLFAGSMLLIAAGAAAAFALMQRQENAAGYTAATPAPDTGAGPASSRVNGEYGDAGPGMPEADANGHPPMA